MITQPLAVETPQPSRRVRGTAARVIGLLLVLPAAFALLFTLVAPTFLTVQLSLQQADIFRDPEFVGAANYEQLLTSEQFYSALGFTGALLGGRLLIVGLLAPLLALAIAALWRPARITLRTLLGLPLAALFPAALAAGWLLALRPSGGPLRSLLIGEGSPFSDPARAIGMLLTIDQLTTLLVACGALLPLYLLALNSRRPLRPFLAIWLLSLLASAALALQSFTPSFLITQGGPMGSTTSLAQLQYDQAFRMMRFGPAAVVATLSLAALGALGLAAWAAIAALGLRLRTRAPRDERRFDAGPPRALAALLLLLLTPMLAGALALSAAPLPLGALASYTPAQELASGDAAILPQEPSDAAHTRLGEIWDAQGLFANSVVPPALALAWQLPLAYLAALGIGALRPFGRHSEWLLLPFSPWLFVGVGPLAMIFYQRLATLGLLNTHLALIPPIAISVPVLFVLTLFFKGQAPRYQAALDEGAPAGSAFLRHFVLPSLPITGLLGLATLIVAGQDLLWPLLVATEREMATFSTALAHLVGGFAGDWPLIGAGLTRAALPFATLTLGALLVFHLLLAERLALSGEDE